MARGDERAAAARAEQAAALARVVRALLAPVALLTVAATASLVAPTKAATLLQREALRSVAVPSGASARADYVAWRTGQRGRALPDHQAAGWRQRTRLRADGRTAVTIAVLAQPPAPPAPWPRRGPLPTDVAAWLPAGDAAPEVERLAEEIALGAATQREVSERIVTWVSANVSHEDEPDHGESPTEVLASGRASCVGRSLLARDLLRTAGIPARTVHAVLAGAGGEWSLHRYLESWVEGAGWLPSDPGRSVHVVDERHVVVALDDRPYDPEAQRGLVLLPAGREDPLVLDVEAESAGPALLVRGASEGRP